MLTASRIECEHVHSVRMVRGRRARLCASGLRRDYGKRAPSYFAFPLFLFSFVCFWTTTTTTTPGSDGDDDSDDDIMASSGDSSGNLNALAIPFEPRNVRSTSLPFEWSPGSLSPPRTSLGRLSPIPRFPRRASARCRAARSSADLSEFQPQVTVSGSGNGALSPAAASYDPFVTTPSTLAAGNGTVPANPYSQDTTAAAATLGAAFYPAQAGFHQPVSVHSSTWGTLRR